MASRIRLYNINMDSVIKCDKHMDYAQLNIIYRENISVEVLRQ